MHPPTGYSVRAATREDLRLVTDLFLAADLVDWGESDFNEDLLREDWNHPSLDLSRDTWVIEDAGGDAVAYGWLIGTNQHRQVEGWGVVHPEHRGRGVGSWLMDLVEARGLEHAAEAPPGDPVMMTWAVIAPDRPGHDLAERRGYRPARYFWRMDIELNEPVPEVRPPEGIEVRTFQRGRDERAFYETFEETFQDHWGHVTRPFDEWRTHRVESEGFDPDLWYLAEDGTAAAGALAGWVMNGEGLVSTLGVRRPWRGRGLAYSLLLRSFKAFQDRGLKKVSLFVDGQNPTGATALYEKAGMKVTRQYDFFQRSLRPGLGGAE